MRILIISSVCLPAKLEGYSGLERVCWLLANELGKEHEVTLAAPKGSDKGNFELFETIEPGYTSLFFDNRIEHLRYIVNNINKEFDVLDCNEHIFIKDLLKIKAKKYFWSLHDYLPHYPSVFNIGFIARSKAHADFLSKLWKLNITYCYNPIVPDNYIYREDKEDFILFFSRICSEKGVLEFIDLAKELKFKGIIAGEDRIDKGANIEYLMKVFKNLPSNVEYLGSVSEKEKLELLSRAKAVVVPFGNYFGSNMPYFEVFGIWSLEALASGTPVFTRNYGALSEILGDCGVVTNTMEELKNKLKYFLEGKIIFDSKKLRERVEMFRVEKIAKEYLNLLLNYNYAKNIPNFA